MNELAKRSVSGALYVALIVAAFLTADRWPWGLVLVFTFFYFAGAWELSGLLGLNRNGFLAMAALGWLFYLVTYTGVWQVPAGPLQYMLSASALLFFAGWLLSLIKGMDGLLARAFAYTGGTAYLLLPLMFALSFPDMAFTVMVILWLYDSFAYLTGKRWGRHKLAPRLSPGKSVEGLVGGTLLTMAAFALIKPWLSRLHLPPGMVHEAHLLDGAGGYLLVLGVILTGTLGDLFESWLKRRAGVKDSGQLIPGHGGILDRLDSFMLNGIVFWLMVWITLIWSM